MKRVALLLGLLVSGLGSGCAPLVSTVSVPPPSRSGSLWVKSRDGEDTIRVSKGVALAIECRDIWWGGPCENAKARTNDSKIARVLPAHLDKKPSPRSDSSYTYENANHRSVFVIAGVEAGQTELTIASDDGNRTFQILVEP